MDNLFIFSMSVSEAQRIERKHSDTSTIKWLPCFSCDTEQVFEINGHPEIVLEIAANLEISTEYIEDYCL